MCLQMPQQGFSQAIAYLLNLNSAVHPLMKQLEKIWIKNDLFVENGFYIGEGNLTIIFNKCFSGKYRLHLGHPQPGVTKLHAVTE